MRVEGQNNRVAMRDYYEKPSLNLTPEQLKELAVKPCGSCETRLVAGSASICRHCREALRERAWKDRMGRYFFAFLCTWGMLIQIQEKTTVIDSFRFFELGACAGAIVFFGAILWAGLKDWWLFHGDELGDAIKKRLGGQ